MSLRAEVVLEDRRAEFRKLFFRKRPYRQPAVEVAVNGECGIESAEGAPVFFHLAERVIDSRASATTFDISNCTRLWPSAITLLCSLVQWVHLTAPSKRPPRLASSASYSAEVNSYLNHCGFYDYVGRPQEMDAAIYNHDDTVRIRHEARKSVIGDREREVMQLLRRHSTLDATGLEYFDSVVLTEVLNNVTEHGIGRMDQGWWLLAQYHRRHRFISVCFADNGIGIRHSLVTGPQGPHITQSYEDDPSNDGEFIALALREVVSGAVGAPVRQGFRKRLPSGAVRGNGLKRVVEVCGNLGVRMALLSHFGYAFVDENGAIVNQGAHRKRIFAGTLYNLIVPAKP